MRFSTVFKAVVLSTLIFAIVGEETATTKGSAVSFTADVAKMLDILVNSLYTKRDIFLREIISNASDAMDKIRFMYLTEPKDPKTDAGDSPTLDIRISFDADTRLLTMRDGGIGMTHMDMQNQLGKLGSSGTKRFAEGMDEDDNNNLIGQFGVGFYSVFLVADKVRVASKNDESEKQWCWESTGDGSYFLYEDERGNTLGRGTELQLHMKKDSTQFLDADKLKETVHRYSEFIQFPIMLQVTKVEKVAKKDDSSAEEGDVQDESTEEKEMEEVTSKVWERINDNKPIWTRKPEDLSEEEYNKFYKSLTKDYDDPMQYTHFSAEGEVEFKALLFVPGRAPYNVFDTSVSQNNIRLYVRRVFITDEFSDLLPRYLNFIKGVVDSDDLPLNVSREVLQESRILKIIKKKLVRKALTMLADIAVADKALEEIEEAKKDDPEATVEEPEAVPGKKKQTAVMFPKFWEEFGKNLRLGMIEDGTNRARLTKLLRYKSSHDENKLTSLEEYVDRMPAAQTGIYFLTGETIDKIKQSPVLEDATNRNMEVLFMVDSIDEYVVGHVTDFAGKKLVNLAKDDAALGDKTKKTKAIESKRREKYQPLVKWFKSIVGSKVVTKIKLTKRKTHEALIVSSPQHGVSARMAGIMKGQTLGDAAGDSVKRVLEINHLHPLIDELFKRIKVDNKDPVAEEIALALFDVATLQSGFEVQDTMAFGQRIGRLVRQSVDIAADAPLIEEDMSEYEVEEEAEDEDKKEEL